MPLLLNVCHDSGLDGLLRAVDGRQAAHGDVVHHQGSTVNGLLANASQIVTLDKSDLGQHTGMLPKSVMDRVDSGLRWFLNLDASGDEQPGRMNSLQQGAPKAAGAASRHPKCSAGQMPGGEPT